MGWKHGEGLGKNNEGSKEPLLLDIKVDRKGWMWCNISVTVSHETNKFWFVFTARTEEGSIFQENVEHTRAG